MYSIDFHRPAMKSTFLRNVAGVRPSGGTLQVLSASEVIQIIAGTTCPLALSRIATRSVPAPDCPRIRYGEKPISRAIAPPTTTAWLNLLTISPPCPESTRRRPIRQAERVAE